MSGARYPPAPLRLNTQQRVAVEHERGPLLVLAGAGSGKTRVITSRIARLLGKGVDPGRVLAVTFTNKAAQEMRERVGESVGRQAAESIWLSTFHSFGVRFVRQEADALGLGRRFTIFDQGDSLGIVRELLKTEADGDRRLDAQAVLSRISLWKNALSHTPPRVPKSDEYARAAAAVYDAYSATLEAMHAVDFDDLVVKPVKLLSERPAIRRRWADRFDHILVDEFQDTNEAQLALIRLLANADRNVCVVGDDDQSIYGWRGACVDNILDFESHFPGAKVAKLEHNYRSRAPILNVANAAIAKSPKRPYAKSLKASRAGGERVRLCSFPEPNEEAQFVAREIRALQRAGTSLSEVAVLYRSNNQAKRIEEELRVAGVPYRIFGGTKFFDRRVIKDAIAYLRVALNPRDELSLRRIVNTPARGLGVQSVAQLASYGEAARLTLYQSLRRATEVASLSPRARASAERLAKDLDRAGAAFRKGSFRGPAEELFRATGLLTADTSDEAKKHRANIEFLLGSIHRIEQRGPSDREALLHLLHHMALDSGDDEASEAGDEVTLSSLHSAKGLEFSVVFLIGCVEGVLPHSRVMDPKITDASSGDLEEERRLFYVGVTRARDLLYLTRARERVHRGRLTKLTPSRFLEGLPEEDTTDYQSEGSRELQRHEVADMAKALLDRLASSD
ncbi:MAG: UvrD-helicase domain-containing protein [Myxococcota bacterium]